VATFSSLGSALFSTSAVWGSARPLDAYFNANGRHRVFAKDCAFRFATSVIDDAGEFTSTPCVRGYGGVYMWLSRCEVTESLGDGVDFRGGKFSSPVRLLSPHILEDRCRMLHCGCHPEDPNRKINQASTMHDGARAVRVGSQYSITGGPCIQDVWLGETNRSAYSVITGCFTFWSLSVDQFVRQGIFLAYSGGGRLRGFTTAWILEHKFTDVYGLNERKPSRRILIRDGSVIAFDADYLVAGTWTATADIVQREDAQASPSLTVPSYQRNLQ